MQWRAVLTGVRDRFGALDRVAAIARALDLANKIDLNFDLFSAVQAAQLLAIVLNLDARMPSRARVLAGCLVRDLASAVDTDYTLHRQLALNRAAVTACDLAQALDLTLGSDDGPDCPAAAELDLSRDLTSALASCAGLLRTLADYPDFSHGRDLTRDLTRYRDLAQGLARYLDSQSAMPANMNVVGAQVLPRTIKLAIWLLPRAWQARYSEEYRADLAELPPWEWSTYGWQALKEVPRLRRELVKTECPPDHARVEG
jgi:hypothetical protein